MRITKLSIKNYKNLQDFSWELNADYPVAVIVGKNGSGKTNLLEAIITIFQDLQFYENDQKGVEKFTDDFPTDFEFDLEYEYGFDDNFVKISNVEKKLQITVNGEPLSLDRFDTLRQEAAPNNEILPRNVFVYYAGISKRLRDISNKSIAEYVRVLREGASQSSINQPLFYYEPIHYRCAFFVLLVSSLENIKKDFLLNDLGITGIESVTFHIQKPDWNKSKDEETFWNAPVYVRRFLDYLREKGAQNSKMEFTLGADILNDSFVSAFSFERGLFQELSNLILVGYLQNIEIHFKRESVGKALEFKDLSEGEWQRIAIRGAMEIFSSEETLFLLDEPDTFAHPRWQWEFVPDLEKAIGKNEQGNFANRNMQAIFITHSPLVLSSLKMNVFMMQKGTIDPLKNVFGENLEIVLSEMGGDSSAVEKDFERYFELIEQGKGETADALKLREDLKEKYGINHTEIARADMLIAFYK